MSEESGFATGAQRFDKTARVETKYRFDRWRVADAVPDGFYLDLQGIAPANNLSLASSLLYNRGIRDDAAARSFLFDGLEELQDPFSLPGVSNAVEVILSAVEKGYGIGIIGDFDADGITATAILILTLRKLGVEAEYHLPHREIEGHGVSSDALSRFNDVGVRVVITVDTGITAFDEVSYANRMGMQVVITDHHIPEDGRLPNAAAIVNPHLADSSIVTDYCGAATAFKLAFALLADSGSGPIPELIPLAAVGTLADQTKLLRDNRIIVREGLRNLDIVAPPGLIELTRLAALSVRHEGPYDSEFISFQLAPRLNAPGRLSFADPSLELLISNDFSAARSLAKRLDASNKERRRLADLVWRDVKHQIETSIASGRRVMALEVSREYPMGILGPLAGKASERSGIPAIAYQVIDGTARASARSVPSFDIYRGISGFANRLIRFGGHAAAAGFAADIQDLDDLLAHLETQASWSALNDLRVDPNVIEADSVLELSRLGGSMWDFVDMMSPFGTANPEPLFVIPNLKALNIRRVGRKANHLSMRLTDDVVRPIRAFGFGLAERMPTTRRLHVLVSLRTSHYRGRSQRELLIKDICAA